MSSLYHKSVHDYINENSENVFNFLKDLVRIPSSLGNEYDAQLNIKDKLVSIGINANLFEADLSIGERVALNSIENGLICREIGSSIVLCQQFIARSI